MRCPSLVVGDLVAVSMDQAPAQTGTAEGVAALARGDYQQSRRHPQADRRGMARARSDGAVLHGDAVRNRAGGAAGPAARVRVVPARVLGVRPPLRGPGRETDEGALSGARRRVVPGLPAARRRRVRSSVRTGELDAHAGTLGRVGPEGRDDHAIKGSRRTVPDATREPGARSSYPVRQTELASGHPDRAPYRYFNEVFLWRPSQDRRSWSLEWHLFEVVRDQLIRINAGVSTGPVARLQFAEPPDGRFFDVRAYVDVRRTPDGRAEWVVLQGPRAGRGIIESRSR